MTEQAATVTTCRYPNCEQAPARASGQPGRPPEYCDNAAHNRVSAWRERRRMDAEQHGTAVTDADAAQPVTMARVTVGEQLRALAAETTTISGIADRIQQALATVGDPDAAAAELEAMRTAAEQRATTAEARAIAFSQLSSSTRRTIVLAAVLSPVGR